MRTQIRLFSRDIIRKVNQDMIDGRPVDLSGLPPRVAQSIRNTRHPREEVNRVIAETRRRAEETA